MRVVKSSYARVETAHFLKFLLLLFEALVVFMVLLIFVVNDTTKISMPLPQKGAIMYNGDKKIQPCTRCKAGDGV